MSDSFIGGIRMFAGNFAPSDWALCDGQLLPISDNDALFSLLGTTYGGDGVTTFGLPDLRGRAAVHVNGQQVQLGLKGTPLTGGKESNGPGTLAINFIICLVGNYPSRN